MKAKLTKIIGIYTLVGQDDRMIASDDLDMQKDYEIGKLSKQNCDEIFGVVDVERIVREEFPYDFDSPLFETLGVTKKVYKSILIGMLQGTLIKGFNKAMELNKDKVFTVEQTIELAKILFSNPYKTSGKTPQELVDSYIQSLQQPTEIEVMIEMKETSSTYLVTIGEVKTTRLEPKLDSEGCLILKRVV
jgi:hypothetical protein